jgi:hypothetical protein
MPNRKPAAKATCPITKGPATCGLDTFVAEMQKLREEVTELRAVIPHTTQLEQYAEMARQISPGLDTLKSIERMLREVLDDRAAGHEQIRKLQTDHEALAARVTLIEHGQRTG